MLPPKSPRLRFINCTPAILEQLLLGESHLATCLDIRIPKKWTEFGEAPFRYVQAHLAEHPESVHWWSWLPVLISENTLVGNCGFKGAPNHGVVEIGYEVAEDYRRRGLATEMAMALIEYAFSFQEVTMILAHTLPFENHSVAILRKCGFRFVTEIMDPEDGLIWRWELSKQ